jgi:hypothetical protein
MIAFEEFEQERSIVTPSLRLRFRWVEDRWTHALEMDRGEDFEPVAEAVEAQPERDDPARIISPTYQDLHLQRDGDAVLALAVGKFGPHHFSASFRVEIEAGWTLIRVDVADRCRRAFESFAATYRVAEAPDHAEEGSVIWELDDPQAGFELSSDLAHVVVAEAGPAGVLAQVETRPDPEQGTHRLLYTWKGRLLLEHLGYGHDPEGHVPERE